MNTELIETTLDSIHRKVAQITEKKKEIRRRNTLREMTIRMYCG